MRGAGPSPRQSPRALRPDPGPAMSFFRRKGSRGGGGGEPGRASGAAVGQMGLPGLPPGRRRDPGRRTDAPRLRADAPRVRRSAPGLCKEGDGGLLARSRRGTVSLVQKRVPNPRELMPLRMQTAFQGLCV